jgi:hypothetical protein
VIDVTEAVIEGTYPEREANTDRLRRVVRTPQRAPLCMEMQFPSRYACAPGGS